MKLSGYMISVLAEHSKSTIIQLEPPRLVLKLGGVQFYRQAYLKN